MTVAFDMDIPALSECVIEGKANLLGFFLSKGVVEPNPRYDVVEMLNEDVGNVDHTQLVVGCTLVDTKHEDIGIPVRIMNPTDESVHLHAGTVIGLISEVEDVKFIAHSERESNKYLYAACGVDMHVCPCNESDVNVEKTCAGDSPADYCKSEWTENLQNLYMRSSELMSLPECKEFSERLDKYPHSLAESHTDLGRTSMTPHEIETRNATPRKLAPRRSPMAFAEDEEKMIQDQLDAGIIVESKSPWASPLVFVKKKDGTTRGHGEKCISPTQDKRISRLPRQCKVVLYTRFAEWISPDRSERI